MSTIDKKDKSYYVITFRDPEENKITSLKASTIRDSSLGISFISISDFTFEQSSSPVVNPTEENLRKRYENTKSLHLLVYSILSIEEVGPDHKGLKFEKDKSNLLVIAPEDSVNPKGPYPKRPRNDRRGSTRTASRRLRGGPGPRP